MDLKRFSAINRDRCTSPQGFNHTMDSWSFAEWTNAIAGETGEACNFTKKLLRHRDGIAGNIKPGDQDLCELRKKAAKEIADIIIYADLAMQALGYDTSTVVRDVFNAKSDEIGCAIRYDDDRYRATCFCCRQSCADPGPGELTVCRSCNVWCRPGAPGPSCPGGAVR